MLALWRDFLQTAAREDAPRFSGSNLLTIGITEVILSI
jgi:hypothetical protein